MCDKYELLMGGIATAFTIILFLNGLLTELTAQSVIQLPAANASEHKLVPKRTE